MSDYFTSENYAMNDIELKWYFHKRSFLQKVMDFLFGKETIDHHFGRIDQ